MPSYEGKMSKNINDNSFADQSLNLLEKSYYENFTSKGLKFQKMPRSTSVNDMLRTEDSANTSKYLSSLLHEKPAEFMNTLNQSQKIILR